MKPVIYSVNHIATSSLQLPALIYIMNLISELLPALLQAREHGVEHLCAFVAGKKHLFILGKCPALNMPRWLDALVVSPVFSQVFLRREGKAGNKKCLFCTHSWHSSWEWGRSECCAGAGYRELHMAPRISPLSPPTGSSTMWPFPTLFMA